MRRLRLLALGPIALLFQLASVDSRVLAQAPANPSASYAIDLAIPGVQAEMNLTDDQKRKVSQSVAAYRELRDPLEKEIRDMMESPEGQKIPIQERQKRMREISSRTAELRRTTGSELDRILTPEQKTRLRGIALQLAGPSAFRRPDVQESLGMNPDQIAQVEVILRENLGTPEMQKLSQSVMGRVQPDAPPDTRETRTRTRNAVKRYDQMHAQATEQILRILTKRQRQTFERMLGPAIDKNKVLFGTIASRSLKDDGDPRLRGEWTIVTTRHRGAIVPAASPIKLIVVDDAMRTEMSGKLISRIDVVADATKDPNEIDLVFQTGPTKGKPRLGIYRIEGDELTYCYGAPEGPRRMNFESPAGTDAYVVTAKRVSRP